MNYKRWISAALVIIMSFFLVSDIRAKGGDKSEFIRFHVIANSDSPRDQAIKLKVRDRVLEEFGEKLGSLHSIDESRNMVMGSLGSIREIAQQEVDLYLPGYRVDAYFDNFDFPTKAYGNLVLPAGSYEALRIVIGKGEGANWWCVMFPPLCFVDISHGTGEEDVKTFSEISRDRENDGDQENSGDQEDGESQGEGGERIEDKFRIFEWWNRAMSILE